MNPAIYRRVRALVTSWRHTPQGHDTTTLPAGAAAVALGWLDSADELNRRQGAILLARAHVARDLLRGRSGPLAPSELPWQEQLREACAGCDLSLSGSPEELVARLQADPTGAHYLEAWRGAALREFGASEGEPVSPLTDAQAVGLELGEE